jgi:hypothetical protein
MRSTTIPAVVCFVIVGAAVAASAQTGHDDHAAMNDRGQHVMGFDQQTTTHHFLLSNDGGRIEVTANDAGDTAAIDQIRSHLRHIRLMFADGNFEAPMLVHAKQPPGTPRMKQAGADITYTFEELPRGARIRMATSSPDAIGAVQEFLRFQIAEHRTGDPTHP